MGKKYTEKQWDEIKEYYLSDDKISYNDITKKYGIPKGTLSYRFKGLKSPYKKPLPKGEIYKTFISTGNYKESYYGRIYEWECNVCGTIKNRTKADMNKLEYCKCQKPINPKEIEKERRRETRKKRKELQEEIDRINQEIRDLKKEQKESYIGQKWGKLTLLEYIENDNVRCQCECGNESTPTIYNILNGTTRSCGCLISETVTKMNTTHGMYRTGVYNSWYGMKKRCGDSNHSAYDNYGGRGIMVCEEWNNSFEAFYQYMGDRPEGMSLDRIDVDGNYEPGNVRWADPKTQARNKRKFRGRVWDDHS